MQLVVLVVCSLISLGHAHPRLPEQSRDKEFPRAQGPATIDDLSASDDDAFFVFRQGEYKNMDTDGVAVETRSVRKIDPVLEFPTFSSPKDLPSMPFDMGVVPVKEDVLAAQPGVVPKFTGSFSAPEGVNVPEESMEDLGESALTNPAGFFLEGADFDKVPAPKCHMVGCTGPMPNDGSIDVSPSQKKNQACHQTFVPLNGCTSNKGYPMGMLCQICCECSKPFVREFMKTRGYKTNFPSV